MGFILRAYEKRRSVPALRDRSVRVDFLPVESLKLHICENGLVRHPHELNPRIHISSVNQGGQL